MASLSRVSITFTAPQLSFLRKEAKRLGLSIGELIRRVVDTYREKETGK